MTTAKPEVVRVVTITQSDDDDFKRSGGQVKWWKVGEFTTVSGRTVKVQRKKCVSKYYKNFTRMFSTGVSLVISVRHVLDGSEILGRRVRIFNNYPVKYHACDPNVILGQTSCGELIVDTRTDSILVGLDFSFLVVVNIDNFYTRYSTIYIPTEDAHKEEMQKLEVNMVPPMQFEQDRTVLQWHHSGDLDLWVTAKWGLVKCPLEDNIYWETDNSKCDDSSIILDVDNQDGTDGPETIRFENLSKGRFEIWVNYKGVFDSSILETAPARVDMY